MHSILHILNHSPFVSKTFEQCFKLSNENGIILFIEDAVVVALEKNKMAEMITHQAEQTPIYVLQEDLAARGLALETRLECVKPVNYQGFVDLIAQCDTSISWT